MTTETETVARSRSEGRAEPLSLFVPVYNETEVDLMRALEQVVTHFMGPIHIGETQPKPSASIARAVSWLNAKYGVSSGE